MKSLKSIISGIIAGILIGMAGTVYFLTENHVAGALLFTFALFMIMVLQVNLFTGKIGYMLEYKNYAEVGLTIVGNAIGCVVYGLVMLQTKFGNTLYGVAIHKMEGKSNPTIESCISIFILAIFCGVCMFLAYCARKKLDDKLGQYVALFLCIMVFILSGYEHSIANIYYITVAKSWSFTILGPLFIMVLGNAVGGIGTWAIVKYLDNNNQAAH